MNYSNPYYRSLLGISEVDNITSNQINTQNITTQNLTVSNLGSGMVSSTSGTLQNALVGTGLNYNTATNTLSNTGVTSLIAGATGPVTISSATGAVTISLPQNLQTTSSPNFTNLGILSTSSTNSLLSCSAGYVVNAISNAPLNYDNITSTLSISLTGSTGINYNVIGSTGYISAILYTAGTNINIVSNVISTVTNPQFERILNSTLALRTVLLGSNSGNSFTTGGVDCVAVGHNTLNSLTTGGSSTACGSQSLRYVTTGGSNTAIGFNALNALQTGSQNTSVGSFSGNLMTTGRFNTLMGMSAGYNLTSGDTNFCLGLNSGYSITTSNDNITIGAYSMGKAANFMTGVNGRNLAIGHYAGHSLEGQPTNNVAIGYQALWNATEVSDNIAIGTNSLATIRASGGGNIAIGGSSTSVGGTLTNGQGYNIGIGIASNLYISGNASNNIGIGSYSNFNTSTGTNNISIGPFTQASTATSSNEITISTNGTIAVPISGRGANTALIDAQNGLYSYSPAYWWGYADNHTGGIITWFAYSDRKNIALKVGDRTQLLLPFIGLYEIALSGNIYVGSVSQNLDVYVNGSLYLQNACFFQTITGWTSCSLNVIVPAYTVNTFVQFTLSGSLGTATSIQLFLKAKFLSLM